MRKGENFTSSTETETLPFKIIGHVNGMGEYPFFIAPVGLLNSDLYIIYDFINNPSKKEFVSVYPEDPNLVLHSDTLQKGLVGFDYRKHRLWAHAANNVVFYEAAREAEFMQSLLADPKYTEQNPYLRLSLAKLQEEKEIFRIEVLNCVKHLLQIMPDNHYFLDQWYQHLKQGYAEKFQLPEKWQDLIV